MTVSSTAPGKIVLLGEYAVLEGAPALAIAANRTVNVEISPTDGGKCRVWSHPLSPHAGNFEITRDGGLQWLDERSSVDSFGLLKSIVDFLSEKEIIPDLHGQGFSLRMDSTNLYHDVDSPIPRKLGLGSSAALTVALAHGLRAYAGQAQLTAKQWLSILVYAHRVFQAGLGSGVDIAASLYGGVVEYQIRDAQPAARPAVLPSGLNYRIIWSGRSASTPGLLRKLNSWRGKNGMSYNKLMDKLGQICAEALLAVRDDDSERFLDAVKRYARNLDALGQRAELDLFSRPHRELSALAIETGLVYKPCGAGGGDLGVAMGTGGNGINRFVDLAEKSGYPALDIFIDPEGVRTIRSI